MLRSAAILAIMASASTAMAQHAHQSGTTPIETGQSTFAAIAEIVTLLSDDPDTNWSDVDIDSLRSHLLDMDAVTMTAEVQTTSDANSVEFTIMGSDGAIASIQRMTTAHSPMLAAETGWSVQSTPQENGARMSILSDDPAQLSRIRGLGFFGVMTIGAHHQQHHLQIAGGANPHN